MDEAISRLLTGPGCPPLSIREQLKAERIPPGKGGPQVPIAYSDDEMDDDSVAQEEIIHSQRSDASVLLVDVPNPKERKAEVRAFMPLTSLLIIS
jgi:hypothetical protein